MRKIALMGAWVAAAAGLLLAGGAAAQTYAPGTYVTVPGQGGFTTACVGTYATYTAGCADKTASTALTNGQALRAAVQQVTGLVGSRIAQFSAPAGGAPRAATPGAKVSLFNSAVEGHSAGAADKPFGVWANASWSSVSDDFVNTRFDGDVLAFATGVDYSFPQRLTLGLAFAYDNTDIDTAFNTGKLESDGYNIVPYAVYRPFEWLSLDLSAGAGWVEKDMNRTNGTVKASTDSERVFGAGNANAYYSPIDKLLLGAHLGFLAVEEEQDAFRESDGTLVAAQDTTLVQFKAGGRAGYAIGIVEPYVLAEYEYDLSREKIVLLGNQAQPANDRDGFNLGGGLNLFASDMLAAQLEASTHLGREDQSVTRVMGTLRFRF